MSVWGAVFVSFHFSARSDLRREWVTMARVSPVLPSVPIPAQTAFQRRHKLIHIGILLRLINARQRKILYRPLSPSLMRGMPKAGGVRQSLTVSTCLPAKSQNLSVGHDAPVVPAVVPTKKHRPPANPQNTLSALRAPLPKGEARSALRALRRRSRPWLSL